MLGSRSWVHSANSFHVIPIPSVLAVLLGVALAAALTAGPGVASAQTISTVAGNGVQGYSGDGAEATGASLDTPTDQVIDVTGNIYIADTGNDVVRKVAAGTGAMTTVAGNHLRGYSGDGGPATNARLYGPNSVALDSEGNLYIADRRNHRVRKVAPATSTITTYAGNGTFGYTGDGGPAINAGINSPSHLIIDSSDNLYISSYDDNRIRRVDAATGIITTVAGTGVSGFAGDGGLATSAMLDQPRGIALDAARNLYIADSQNKRIRKVSAGSGAITTLAGNGSAGFVRDGVLATDANLGFPRGVTVDTAGNAYIADTQNHRVRRVDADSGLITTVAGNGSTTFSGDGGPAENASLFWPSGLKFDSNGDLYLADEVHQRIRKISLPRTYIPRLVNIATRGRVQTGANVMIAGFIIGGSTPKKVLITARGPSVPVLPSEVPLLMADPKVTLFSGAIPVASNDNWQTLIAPPNPSLITLLPSNDIPATMKPGNAKDAAILTTLAPGAYTAIVEGVGGATGLSIVEVFEVDKPDIPLVNIATRGLVESGANVMIAGFIIQGNAPKKVLVTARGQSVAVLPSEVPLLMKNPMLQLYSGATPIAENDDWQTLVPPPSGSPVVLLPPTDIPATQKPGDVKDAAILTTLAPGAYTAIVTDSSPGIAIVEVFAQ